MAKIFPPFIYRVVFFSVGLFFTTSLLLAAELTISPMFQEIEIHDETEVVAEVLVSNTTPVETPFRIEVYDFGSLDQSGGVAFLGASQDLGAAYALAPWVKVDQDRIALAPHEQKVIKVTILNSQDLAPGGHYGALVFRSTNDAALPENGIAIQQMLASLLFVNKLGGSKPAITLEQVKGEQQWFSPPKLTLDFRNSGNVHITPRGYVELLDPFERVKAKGIINEASAIILPDAGRLMPVVFKPQGLLWFPSWYTMKVAYRFDGDENFQFLEQKIFIFPIHSLWFIGGACLLFGSWQFFRRKRSFST